MSQLTADNVIVIETCPKCGGNLGTLVIATYPPIPKKMCMSCGWYWEGKVEKSKEILMMIKTRRTNYAKIKLVIEDIHPYFVPEIIALPIIDCSEDYLKWLVSETET